MSRRVARPVGLPRARARTTAYVYGNILVLAAVLTTTPSSVEDGHAVLVVGATALTTLLAHVVSHAVGHAIGRDPLDPQAPGERREELRDALPILSSGVVPTAVLLLAWLADLDPGAAVLIAAATTVLRLSAMGFVVGGLSGRPPSAAQWWSGVGIAGVSAVIAVLKVVLTH